MAMEMAFSCQMNHIREKKKSKTKTEQKKNDFCFGFDIAWFGLIADEHFPVNFSFVGSFSLSLSFQLY